MEDKYAELRAALDAISPGNGDSMLAYRLASDPKTIRALLAERDTLRVTLKCIAQTRTKPGDDKAALLLASFTNLAFAALAQGQGDKE